MDDDGPRPRLLAGDTFSQHDATVVVELEVRHGQAMFEFVRGLGLRDDQAEDCVQEGLLRLWTELRRGTPIADAKGWTYRTIYRLAMDEHRLRRRVAALMAVVGNRWVHTAAPAPDAS